MEQSWSGAVFNLIGYNNLIKNIYFHIKLLFKITVKPENIIIMRLLNTTLLVFFAAIFALAACNKSGKETTAADNELQATSDIAIQGANDETSLADDENAIDMNIPLYLSDARNPESITTSECPKITVTPQTGFPRTVVMDFGSGCTREGITRTGQIIVMISDYRNKPGATAVTTFNQYTINSIKKEGKITWTNTTTDGVRSWERKVENVKMTREDGKFTIHNALKQTTQIAGGGTPIAIDDAFATTGRGVIRNSEGISRTHVITIPLEKYNNCRWISKGAIKTEGNSHTVVTDYGDGNCDNKATVSRDGKEPVVIILK